MASISRGSCVGDLGPSVTKMGGGAAIKTWSFVEGGKVGGGGGGGGALLFGKDKRILTELSSLKYK